MFFFLFFLSEVEELEEETEESEEGSVEHDSELDSEDPEKSACDADASGDGSSFLMFLVLVFLNAV